MTDNIENLILEHLRAIRADVGQIKDDLATVKQRLTSVETQIAHLCYLSPRPVRSSLTNPDSMNFHQQ